MENTNIVRVRVQQADFECDEYGVPVVEPKSIKVALILVVKNALDCSIKEAKDAVEASIKAPTGRVVFALVLDDAGLGRLTRTVFDRREMNANRSRLAQLTEIEIEGIRTDRVITVGG
jgi:hypothetical protein